MPCYAEEALQAGRIRFEIILDSGICDAFNHPEAKQRCGYAKNHVARVGEVGLFDVAAGRIIGTSHNRKNVVNAAVERCNRSETLLYKTSSSLASSPSSR